MGTYVSSGVKFYMSGFCFHRAPLSAVTVLLHPLTGRAGSVSEKSLSRGHQILNIAGGRARFRWSQQRCDDLKELGEETTLGLSSLEMEAQGKKGEHVINPGFNLGWISLNFDFCWTELDSDWSPICHRLDSMTFRDESSLLNITCFECKDILADTPKSPHSYAGQVICADSALVF